MYIKEIKQIKKYKKHLEDAMQSSTTGFTIIEAFVAITILLVAVVGPLSIVTSGLSSAIFAKEQVIASFLAEEAVEVARNRRDENVINGNEWTDSFGNVCRASNGGCIVDVIDGTFTSCGGSCTALLFNSVNGQYGYSSGNPTIFTRQLVTEQIEADKEEKITVTVTWKTGLLTKTITVHERFFNWE